MTGDFSLRIVEAEPDQAFFRIYSEHAYPAVWHVFRGVPDDLENPVGIEERWVADCMGTPGTEQTPLQDASCLTYFRWNSLLVQISFPGSLIPRSDELRARIGTMIDGWYADANTSSQSQP